MLRISVKIASTQPDGESAHELEFVAEEGGLQPVLLRTEHEAPAKPAETDKSEEGPGKRILLTLPESLYQRIVDAAHVGRHRSPQQWIVEQLERTRASWDVRLRNR